MFAILLVSSGQVLYFRVPSGTLFLTSKTNKMKAEEIKRNKEYLLAIGCHDAIDCIDYLQSQLKEKEKEIDEAVEKCDNSHGMALEYKSQLKEIERLLKSAVEYYNNDKYANRAKSMKSLIDDALDELTQTKEDGS